LGVELRNLEIKVGVAIKNKDGIRLAPGQCATYRSAGTQRGPFDLVYQLHAGKAIAEVIYDAPSHVPERQDSPVKPLFR
jgi:hypothetical protein